MNTYKRITNLSRILEHKSLFLFGPRQTGKTTLLREKFPEARYWNLLQADTFRELSSAPELLRERLSPHDSLVIVDEVQKLPVLLDEVHSLIESNKKLRFVLTGSSARKLKRGGANLLAGRAWTTHLHPLVSPELNFARLDDQLRVGGLPSLIDSPYPLEDLKAYVGTYLREEIQAEALTRSIENFSRFLDSAGLDNGRQLNFTKISNDAGVPARTIREYYQILVDTLVGFMLEPYQKTKKRKAVSTPKFYFFDVGVANYLMKRGEILPGSANFGEALEHLILLELKAYLDYNRIDVPLCYWRSQSKLEVDVVVGDSLAIEIKGSKKVNPSDMKGLRALAEDIPLKHKIVVSLESERRCLDDGIEIIPVEVFLKELWAGEFQAFI